jgi:hypothetical protein
MGQPSDGVLSPTPRYCEIMGRAAEIARALGSPAGGAEHLFLGMIHDGGWPVSTFSHLVDPGRAEEAVLAILGAPGYSPPPPPPGTSRATATPGRGAGKPPRKWAILTSAWSTRCWP